MRKLIVLLGLMYLLTQCKQNVSIENAQIEHNQIVDSLDITSFSLERKNDIKLSDWKPYQINDEIISVPPNWSGKIVNQMFVLTPINNIGDSEGITFKRSYRDNEISYDVIAQQLIEKSFSNYHLIKEDTLKKVFLAKDMFFQRTFLLSKKNIQYKGYAMVYLGDRYVYTYNMVLSLDKLQAYKGDFFNDVFGNIKINNKYFLSNDNPIKKIIYIH